VYRFMDELHPVEEAVSLVYTYLRGLLSREMISVYSSLGRYASSPVYSTRDVPPYNRSVVDGCAARSIDVGGAAPEAPVMLKLKGKVSIGDDRDYNVGPGECFEVATGSRLPVNADVVIPVEYVEFHGAMVVVTKGFSSGYGVARRGEDLGKGMMLVRRGERIDDFHVGLLASIGLSEIEVWRLPRVCIFSTGDELVEPGEEYASGKVYASTGYLVKSLLEKLGFSVEYHGIAGDSELEIEDFFARLLSRCPIVVSTGGTSVGEKDVVARVVSEKFSDQGFIHGIALTPGRPMGIGVSRLDGEIRLVLALSGMPVAAYTEIVAVLEPALAKAVGRDNRIFREFTGILDRKLVSRPGMTSYVRASTRIVDGRIIASPLRLTGSGILSTLLAGDSMIVIPPEVTGYDKGETVKLVSTRLYG